VINGSCTEISKSFVQNLKYMAPKKTAANENGIFSHENIILANHMISNDFITRVV